MRMFSHKETALPDFRTQIRRRASTGLVIPLRVGVCWGVGPLLTGEGKQNASAESFLVPWSTSDSKLGHITDQVWLL